MAGNKAPPKVAVGTRQSSIRDAKRLALTPERFAAIYRA